MPSRSAYVNAPLRAAARWPRRHPASSFCVSRGGFGECAAGARQVSLETVRRCLIFD
jgi:hypothetical protein